MSTWVKVARYHLVRPTVFAMPWWNTAFAFAVSLVIYSQLLAADAGPGRWTAASATLFTSFFVTGVVSVGRLLPFGLTLGMSRRSYYTGTALLGVAMAMANATIVTVLQAIERATDGWGVAVGFFRVPYLLDGPWYLTWLTSFAGLAVLFVYGMWFGTVYRRWGLFGTMAFIIAQVTVAVAAVLAVTWTHAWPSVGEFFTSLTVLGLTGLLAVATVVLLVGGHATIRRVTV